MTFTDQELRGALIEAKKRLCDSRLHYRQSKEVPFADQYSFRAIYRESLATVAALNFLIAARKKKSRPAKFA